MQHDEGETKNWPCEHMNLDPRYFQLFKQTVWFYSK